MKLNENLFQLGLDAHIKAVEIADSDPVAGYESKIWQNIYRTKFAELIIRECALVVHKKTGPKSALNVLEHFGVEE